MKKVRLEKLSTWHLRRCKAVFVHAEDGSVVKVRETRTLLRQWISVTPVTSDLLILVPMEAGNPEKAAKAALEYLGFIPESVVVH